MEHWTWKNSTEGKAFMAFVEDKFPRGKALRADGSDYVDHCLRVSAGCKTYHAAMLGLLHDVLEDTDTTMAEIRERFNLDYSTCSELLCLTHKKGTSYESYIYGIVRNGTDAVKDVKFNDLIDNVGTLYKITDEKRRTRLEQKYELAWSILVTDPYFENLTTEFRIAFSHGTKTYKGTQA